MYTSTRLAVVAQGRVEPGLSVPAWQVWWQLTLAAAPVTDQQPMLCSNPGGSFIS